MLRFWVAGRTTASTPVGIDRVNRGGTIKHDYQIGRLSTNVDQYLRTEHPGNNFEAIARLCLGQTDHIQPDGFKHVETRFNKSLFCTFRQQDLLLCLINRRVTE